MFTFNPPPRSISDVPHACEHATPLCRMSVTAMCFCLQGFCLPADMTDEMEGEGATQFEDIEGGGMGEGEGAKDVSDQIETEDQVRVLH